MNKNQSSELVRLLFQIASGLTDPVCKTREFYWRMRVTGILAPGKFVLVRTFGLIIAMVFSSIIAIPATLIGIVVRALAITFENHSFSQAIGKPMIKPWSNNLFTLLSWNVCGINAGYSITDGGVTPWRDRIDSIITKIKTLNPDVLVLQEVFDSSMAEQLMQNLRHDYAHFYFNIGVRPFGLPAGFFVASKFAVSNPEFHSFPPGCVIGRTKFMNKGFFVFQIMDQENPRSTIVVTHPQQSEECAFPTLPEQQAREKSMDTIVEYINSKNYQQHDVILVGDLNLDDAEFDRSNWKHCFDDRQVFTEKTWRGDEFCARLVGKKISPALNYDYMLSLRGTVASMNSVLVETGYNPKVYSSKALSDHEGLFGMVHLKQNPPIN